MPGVTGFSRGEQLDANATAEQLKRASSLRPSLAIVLGSGFGQVLKNLKIDVRVPYHNLPGFTPATVSGHAGEVLIGSLAETEVIILSGRCHFYEGHPMQVVTFAVRVLASYGIQDLLLTNAAGGVNRRFRPGDFMLLTDHINLMGSNPLRGGCPQNLPRFVDLSDAYNPALSALMRKAAARARIRLRSGVYLAISGPSYETPAEIRAFARLGADAVGMSTVPEVIVARQCGLRVAGLSCITNFAAGLTNQPLSHEEVLETAAMSGHAAARLLGKFVELYAHT